MSTVIRSAVALLLALFAAGSQSGPQQLYLATGYVDQSTDPYWSSVVLLAHFEGTNGASTFTDGSASAHTMTNSGGTAPNTNTTSSTQAKFGSTSWNNNGSSQRIALGGTTTDWNFGSGDFTIEWWEYNDPTGAIISWQREEANPTLRGFAVQRYSAAGLYVYQNWNAESTTWTFTAPANQWSHVALVKISGAFTVYVNGANVAIATQSAGFPSTYNNTTGYLGSLYNTATIANTLSGYVDDLRVTKGVGRYTGNFIIRSTAFPDS